MRDITLEIPLGTFTVVRGGQGSYTADAGVETLGDPLDHTPFTRRIATFKANRRGYISAIILLSLFTLSVFAELIANDKPLLVRYDNIYYSSSSSIVF